MIFSDIDKFLGTSKTSLAICMPEDKNSIEAIYEASNFGFINPVLVGNSEIINDLISNYAHGLHCKIIDAKTPEESAFKSVELIRNKEASAIMKGSISTPTLLKAILNSETGIKNSPILSHVLAFEFNNKLIYYTDGGMIPYPTLKEKIEIIKNAKKVAQTLSCQIPKIAVISATDTIVPDMQSSLDAAIISKMSERGMFGNDCVIDGPLTIDDALIPEQANSKGIFSEVAGNADILIAHNIDAGNIVGKSILYYGNVQAGGMIIGAKVPIVMLSRSDTKQLRINSIKLALAYGQLTHQAI